MNIFRLAGDMTHLASVLVLLLKIHTIKSCAGISLKTQELYALVFATRYLDIFTSYVSFYNTVMKLIFLGSSFSIVWYIRRHKIVRRSYDKDQDTFRHWFLVLPCLVFALLINERFTVKEVIWTFSLYLEAVAILPQLVLLQRTRNIDNLTGQYVFLLGLLGFVLLDRFFFITSAVSSDIRTRWFTSENFMYNETYHWGGTIQTSWPDTITNNDMSDQYTALGSIWFIGSAKSAYRALYILNWIYRYFTEVHYVHWITWVSGFVQTLLYADFFYYYFQSWKNNEKLHLPA